MAGGLVALGIVYIVVDRAFGVATYYALISGPALILTVIFNPIGLAGRMRLWWEQGPRWTGAHGAVHPEPATSGPADVRPPGDGRNDRPASCWPPAGITVTYGGLRAVDALDVEVRAGEIVGLIGPNGAGKTSFIDAVTGFTPCTGEVYLNGEAIGSVCHTAGPPRASSDLESVELFDDLSAADNVRVGSDSGHDGGGSWPTSCGRTRRPPRRPATPSS